MAHGDAAIAARIAEYRSAGIDLPALFPMPVAGVWPFERVIAEFGPSARNLEQETLTKKG